MNDELGSSSKMLPAVGTKVEFACGGLSPREEDTPYALYRGEFVFFCLPVCKRIFERQPDKFMSGSIPHFEEI